MPRGPLGRKRLTNLGPFVEDNGDLYDKIVRRLSRWGATRFTDKDTFLSIGTIDFEAPFPGEHPIRSAIHISDVRVERATIRYGSLQPDLYEIHPTDDPEQLQRLADIAKMQILPEADIVVNYGDTHRVPRPHLLVGWVPSVDNPGQIVQSSPEYPGYVDVDDLLDLIVAFGKDVREEFEGEWA